MSLNLQRNILASIGWAAFFVSGCQPLEDAGFSSNWPQISRVWLGPEYWANPLQDWALNHGRLECITSGGDRNIYLLTHEISGTGAGFKISVQTGYLSSPPEEEGWVGFKVGVRGEFNDYRDSAVRGEGLPVGINTKGHLFIGSRIKENSISLPLNAIDLSLLAEREDDDSFSLTIQVTHLTTDQQEFLTVEEVPEDWIQGGIALVCSAGSLPQVSDTREIYQYPDWGTDPDTPRRGDVNFWFKQWEIEGEMIKEFPERKWGPVLFNQFTINKGVVRMTAQFPPLGPSDPIEAYLEIKPQENWESVDTARIDSLSYTARFDYQPDQLDQVLPYRIVYSAEVIGEDPQPYYYYGQLPRDPSSKQELVLAAFTGNNDLGFPNPDLVGNVRIQDPDLLFFSGDQIYEGVGGYGVQRGPLSLAVLDYLRKWYLYGWAFGELLRDIPVVTIPDDHDVYHGNLWGESGKATDEAETESGKQDTGGYKMPASWVNMVQKTQTSHFPDPFDPTPVKQGISVYYTNLEYAGISFAILEDRKFKSAPKLLLNEAQVDNGWAQNPDFDPVNDSDHPQAKLLGSRQLNFLEHWAEHWEPDTWMKVVLSQTIFTNLATLPAESRHDRIVPQLRVLPEGEYAPNDIQVADMDSNGWPRSGRNQALSIIRKAFALHVAGDQHLGSTLEYGIDEFGDAGFALCVPSVSNVWPRRWYPPPSDQEPPYRGNFLDGFGNKITVHAVSNPVYTGRQPSKLYDRATGYGIVRFRAADRKIIMENWPRDAHPQSDKPYAGWPVIIDQLQNYQPGNGIFIPKLQGPGLTGSLIQLYDREGEHSMTLRAGTDTLRLSVPEAGNYLLHITPTEGEKQEHEVRAYSNNQDIITLP